MAASVVDESGVLHNQVIVPVSRASVREYTEIFKWLFKRTRPVRHEQGAVVVAKDAERKRAALKARQAKLRVLASVPRALAVEETAVKLLPPRKLGDRTVRLFPRQLERASVPLFPEEGATVLFARKPFETVRLFPRKVQEPVRLFPRKPFLLPRKAGELDLLFPALRGLEPEPLVLSDSDRLPRLERSRVLGLLDFDARQRGQAALVSWFARSLQQVASSLRPPPPEPALPIRLVAPPRTPLLRQPRLDLPMPLDPVCAAADGTVHGGRITPLPRRPLVRKKEALRALIQRRAQAQVEGVSPLLALALDGQGVVRGGARRRNRICAAADGTIYAENIVQLPQRPPEVAQRKEAHKRLLQRKAPAGAAASTHLALALGADGVVREELTRRNRICAGADGTIHAANIVPKAGPSLAAQKRKAQHLARVQNAAPALPTLLCDLEGRMEVGRTDAEVVVAATDGQIHAAHVKPVTAAHQALAKKRAKKQHRAYSAPHPQLPVLSAHPHGYACAFEAQPEPEWHFWNPEPLGADFETVPEEPWKDVRAPEADWVLVM